MREPRVGDVTCYKDRLGGKVYERIECIKDDMVTYVCIKIEGDSSYYIGAVHNASLYSYKGWLKRGVITLSKESRFKELINLYKQLKNDEHRTN